MVASSYGEVKIPNYFRSLKVCIDRASSMWAALALSISILFGFLSPSYAQLPRSTGAPKVGQKAPSFTLSDQHGNLVSLRDLLKPAAGGRAKSGGLVLIFYRGYW